MIHFLVVQTIGFNYSFLCAYKPVLHYLQHTLFYHELIAFIKKCIIFSGRLLGPARISLLAQKILSKITFLPKIMIIKL